MDPSKTKYEFKVKPTVKELADFAATMTYLMWNIRKRTAYSDATKSFSNVYPIELPYLMGHITKPQQKRTTNEYNLALTASSAFKRFCWHILDSTKVGESVVYLCLKYVAILLESKPSIRGAEGSEYRLFLISLLLANKYLDDNPYVNQSWSNVSGIGTKDLNRMEAEFLEAVDFDLHVGAQDFAIWKILLETCRQRYPVSYDDSTEKRKKAIYNSLHLLGMYDNQFNSHTINVQVRKDNDVDHIARITRLLDISYQRFLSSKNTTPQLNKWQYQPYYQWPTNLHPPSVRYGRYKS